MESLFFGHMPNSYSFDFTLDGNNQLAEQNLLVLLLRIEGISNNVKNGTSCSSSPFFSLAY